MRPPESFIAQPIRSLQTMLRLIAEDDKRFLTVVPDGIYGPTTMAAVTEIQKAERLPLTGITNEETWNAIVARYEDAIIRVGKAEPIEIIMNPGQVFRLGDQGPYIYLTQSMLIWLSNDLDITEPCHTGIFDEETANALMEFQSFAGLPQTGELDKITWKHLSRHFSSNAHHNSEKNVITETIPE